jgi:hypothetical protein
MAIGRSWQSLDLTKQYLYAVTLVFVLNALSAILFMVSVRGPVYDDDYHIVDVHAYASQGISRETVRAQRNAPGPTSYFWMAAAVRLLDRDELLDSRLAVLLSWTLLTALLVVGARHSKWPELWYGALLATLIFPHAAIASATVLTEGPGLLFALTGTLAWAEAVSRSGRLTAASFAWLAFGGLSIGLAVTCRQYFMALLPAAGALALVQVEGRDSTQLRAWLSGIALSLALAAMPVIFLVLAWRGVTSPGIATGKSYSNYHAAAGFALFRPVVVILFAAIYLVPYSFPAMLLAPLKRRWPAVLSSLLIGSAATHFRDSFLDMGLLHTLVVAASRIPAGGAILFWLLACLAAYNAIAVCSLIWAERSRLRARVPVMFALFAIFFFVAEQIGVGGNIPFYDRYILQLAPFLGMVGFWISPRLTWQRILVMGGMIVVSQATLWQHAIVGHAAH